MLIKIAEELETELTIVKEIVKYNNQRKDNLYKRVVFALNNNVKNKNISVLGLSFKPETDDMRESPAINIICSLLNLGAKISAYDPEAINEARKILPKKIVFERSANNCIKNSDVVIIVTEWNEFRAINPKTFVKLMRGNIIIDFRNIYDPHLMKNSGLVYFSVGRK